MPVNPQYYQSEQMAAHAAEERSVQGDHWGSAAKWEEAIDIAIKLATLAVANVAHDPPPGGVARAQGYELRADQERGAAKARDAKIAEYEHKFSAQARQQERAYVQAAALWREAAELAHQVGYAAAQGYIQDPKPDGEASASDRAVYYEQRADHCDALASGLQGPIAAPGGAPKEPPISPGTPGDSPRPGPNNPWPWPGDPGDGPDGPFDPMGPDPQDPADPTHPGDEPTIPAEGPDVGALAAGGALIAVGVGLFGLVLGWWRLPRI